VLVKEGQIMRISKVLIASCVLLLGAAAAQADHAGSLSSHRTLLTFSGPVALPGVSLSAGTYTFELADRNGSPDLVVVRNREQSHVCYLGLTQHIERPRDLPADRLVLFGEARRGMPAPISAWFPIGESRGYQFLYRTR